VARIAQVAIALGSNVGDRREHLEYGVSRLSACVSTLRVSPIRETEPFGVGEPQSPYLNAVAIGSTTLEPDALIAELMAIEQARGRTRPSPRAPRTLDMDLILFGDRVVDRPGLTLPHPRFRERLFVLEPLADLAPDWNDPVSGKTVRALLSHLRRSTLDGRR
jgi:2-amino-4-hydroxy-6-hydroxymethyldihydropteridine diphosphokinase